MLRTNLLVQGVHFPVTDSHTRHRRHLSKGKQNTFKGTVHRQSYHQDRKAKILVSKQILNTRKTWMYCIVDPQEMKSKNISAILALLIQVSNILPPLFNE
jgi:hypothetical protein